MREVRARRGKKPWVVVWFIWPRKRRPEGSHGSVTLDYLIAIHFDP